MTIGDEKVVACRFVYPDGSAAQWKSGSHGLGQVRKLPGHWEYAVPQSAYAELAAELDAAYRLAELRGQERDTAEYQLAELRGKCEGLAERWEDYVINRETPPYIAQLLSTSSARLRTLAAADGGWK